MNSYALWHIPTNNMIRDFDNERDALALVLDMIELNGPELIESLALDVELDVEDVEDEDEVGEGYLIAYGQELAERARGEFATRPADQSSKRAS